MTQFCHFSIQSNSLAQPVDHFAQCTRIERVLCIPFRLQLCPHMSVEAQNLFKLHYGIKICNSTNRAQDHGYGWEPGPGQGSSSTTKVQDPWLCPCVCGYVGLDSFAWLGPFGYCGLGSLLRLTLWPSAGLIAGIRLWDFLQGPTGPMQCELNSLRLKGLRLAYCSRPDRVTGNNSCQINRNSFWDMKCTPKTLKCKIIILLCLEMILNNIKELSLLLYEELKRIYYGNT